MTQEQLRMQMLAGIITESQYKEMLNESENLLSMIEDYVSAHYTSDQGYGKGKVEEAEDWKDQKMHSDVTNKDYKVAEVYAWAKKNTKQVTIDIKNTDALEWWNKLYDMDNKAHKKRMMNADTSYPILGIKLKDGTISVADGLNRVKKAHDIEHKKSIKAYVITQKDLENIDGKEK
jgi:hypothetical protein